LEILKIYLRANQWLETKNSHKYFNNLEIINYETNLKRMKRCRKGRKVYKSP
jgi:hypothetical protein